jgi:hypothetical protein
VHGNAVAFCGGTQFGRLIFGESQCHRHAANDTSVVSLARFSETAEPERSALRGAGAFLLGRHRGHDLRGMLAAAVPGGLLAAGALNWVAHGSSPSSWSDYASALVLEYPWGYEQHLASTPQGMSMIGGHTPKGMENRGIDR